MLGALPAAASHLVGGEMSYKYLGADGPSSAPFRYRVTVLIYVNADPITSQVPDGRPRIDVGFYNKSQNGALISRISLPLISSPIVTPAQPSSCTTPGTQSLIVRLCRYETVVNLPVSFDGYYAVYSDGTRNAGISNLLNSDQYAQLIYAEMAPPLLPNSSPTFSDTAVAVICQGDTSILVNNAVDPDGDRLIYSFSRPYGPQQVGGGAILPNSFTGNPTPVPYNTGYSLTAPFGPGPGSYAYLNASNGLSRYAAPRLGAYVVAVEVKEYRTINGAEVLIGATRRDIQLVVRTCPANNSPVISASSSQSSSSRVFTVEEGQPVSFNLTATDVDGNPINLKANSVLLDGAGGFDASFGGNPGAVVPGNPTGSATLQGTGGRVSGQFVFNSRCGNARATPYDVVVTATDITCGAKSVADIYQIYVTKASGPTGITGEAVICDRAQASTYTATGPTAGSYRWTVRGGTIQGANTGSSVQVLWNTAGTGQVVLRGVSAYGCDTDSVTRTVDVRQAGALSVTPTVTICPGNSTTLTATGGVAYTWTGGGQTFTGASITVSPPQTTTYTVTTTDGVCTTSRQTTVIVGPGASPFAGNDQSVCPGGVVSLGATDVPGFTYRWSPAVGLSSTTSAQPTFTAPASAAPGQVYTFTLTATTPQGCTGTATVRITINPPAVANAGPDQTVCDGQRLTLGTPALPGYTYQWTPATGLGNTSSAQPVLTASNRTQAPVTLTYTLTASSAQTCAATSTVRITINPRPEADTIQGSASVCPTVQGVAYSIRNPRGTAYQWIVTGGRIASGQGTSAITVNWDGPTTSATVQAYRLNAQGCSSDTTTFPVRVNQQLITQKPTGPLQVCMSDGPFTYQTLYTNGSTYAWQIVGGTQVSTNQASVQVNWTRTGIVKLVVTESSNPAGGRCFGQSDTLYVNVLPAPATNLAIAGPDRGCAGTGNLTFSLPGAATSTYVFALNGTTLTGTGNTVTLPTPAASTVPYTLTIKETNANGCAGVAYTKTFLIVPPLAITGPPSYCPEARTGLAYTATGQANGTYQWTILGGTIISGQGTNAVVVDIPAGATNVTLSVTETTSTSCAATLTIRPDNATIALNTASVELTDDRKITLALNVPNNTGNTNRVQILRRDAGSTGAYAVIGNAANTATTFTDNTVDADAKAYQYRINLTNACGTLLNSQEHTTILTKATATQSNGGRNVGQAQISWTAYQGFVVKEYRVLRAVDNGTAELIATVPATTLQYSLASSTAGFNQCFRVQAVSTEATPRISSSNNACVAYENPLAFYNIITPNGDGKNDVLTIDNVALYPNNSLTIFNRWGKQVYATTNYRNTYGGQDQGAGMYYYLFKLQDGTSYKGWFEITR
ncbi:T9SS type B sorting domain-containing protein [Hymenobacter gelipurpurascens]|uniref:T9SS type B sorting domain-containing protein n=1 Tax=Hymenobacter gelipurpurascens TaxID=89968 RepID=UPI0011315292|nr:gliding motility-associated C-terminal domain-containing protein [Hymenobacter gelipurpurascens]